MTFDSEVEKKDLVAGILLNAQNHEVIDFYLSSQTSLNLATVSDENW